MLSLRKSCMDSGHTLSWQAEPSFVEEEAHPTEHSLYVWVLVASMVIGQVFQTLMGLWPLLNTLLGAKVMKNALFLSSYFLLLLFHSLVILLVWVSPLSCRKKTSSRLVQKRRTSGYEFLRVLEYFFYSWASTNFWSTNYMAIILLKSATTTVLPVSSAIN